MIRDRQKPYRTLIISTLVVLFATAQPLYADIYQYIDSQGVMHFTNIPTSAKYRVYTKEWSVKSLVSYNTKRYDHLITGASHRVGISFPLLKALIKTESDFNPLAVSKAGAKGLTQIMPENVKALNIKNPFDPWENIMGGARYLQQLIRRFDGKLPLALAAYNAGPNLVEQYQSIPPFKETEDFVKKVLKYYALFKEEGE
jgi:soluble lytic murein transglycosylase